MGLILDLYRSDDYRSPLCVFAGVRSVCVLNIAGPFRPGPDAPAAVLEYNRAHALVIRPAIDDELPAGRPGMAFGGTYAASSDSRYAVAVGFYGAVPVHDYFCARRSWRPTS